MLVSSAFIFILSKNAAEMVPWTNFFLLCVLWKTPFLYYESFLANKQCYLQALTKHLLSISC